MSIHKNRMDIQLFLSFFFVSLPCIFKYVFLKIQCGLDAITIIPHLIRHCYDYSFLANMS